MINSWFYDTQLTSPKYVEYTAEKVEYVDVCQIDTSLFAVGLQFLK